MDTDNIMKKPNNTNNQNQQKPAFGQYVDAAKAAFSRIWNNKWLWFWGIFLPMGAGVSGNFNFGNNDFGENEQVDGYVGDAFTTIKDFLFENLVWIVLGVLLLIALNIIIWIVSAIARSGVIQAIHQLQTPTEALTFGFKDIWHKGKKDALKIITIDVLIFVGILIIVLILATPIVVLGVSGNFVGAIMIGIMALILMIPIMILASYLKQTGVIIAVLSEEKARKSIEGGYSLVSKNIVEALKLLVVNFVLRFIQGFVVVGAILVIAIFGVIAAVFFGLVIGGFEDVVTNLKNNVGVLVGIGIVVFILILIFILISLVIKAFFSLWQQDVWVWWVKRLGGVIEREDAAVENEKEKIPESETAPSTNISSRK